MKTVINLDRSDKPDQLGLTVDMSWQRLAMLIASTGELAASEKIEQIIVRDDGISLRLSRKESM